MKKVRHLGIDIWYETIPGSVITVFSLKVTIKINIYSLGVQLRPRMEELKQHLVPHIYRLYVDLKENNTGQTELIKWLKNWLFLNGQYTN